MFKKNLTKKPVSFPERKHAPNNSEQFRTIPNDPERFRMTPNVLRKTLPMADPRRTSPIVAERSGIWNLDAPNV